MKKKVGKENFYEALRWWSIGALGETWEKIPLKKDVGRENFHEALRWWSIGALGELCTFFLKPLAAYMSRHSTFTRGIVLSFYTGVVLPDQGVFEKWEYAQRREIFCRTRRFSAAMLLCIAGEINAVWRKKIRCLGMLSIFPTCPNRKRGISHVQKNDSAQYRL